MAWNIVDLVLHSTIRVREEEQLVLVSGCLTARDVV